MKTVHWFCALALVVFAAPAVSAQEPAKPGPEHDVLKKFVGTWDLTMKTPGGESKGTSTYKMDLGGLWLSSSLEMDFGGMKFQGKGMDTYDAAKKKYVSVWFDSMMTHPLLMEGTYDKEKKTLTLAGESPGMDGKPTKWKSVTATPDDDTIDFKMHMGDDKEPAFTIIYKRKK
jgi:hypothetical protein